MHAQKIPPGMYCQTAKEKPPQVWGGFERMRLDAGAGAVWLPLGTVSLGVPLCVLDKKRLIVARCEIRCDGLPDVVHHKGDGSTKRDADAPRVNNVSHSKNPSRPLGAVIKSSDQ